MTRSATPRPWLQLRYQSKAERSGPIPEETPETKPHRGKVTLKRASVEVLPVDLVDASLRAITTTAVHVACERPLAKPTANDFQPSRTASFAGRAMRLDQMQWSRPL